MEIDLVDDLLHRIRVLENMILNLLQDYYELKHDNLKITR